MATGHVDKGAIISAAGDSAWAASADFQVNRLLPPLFIHKQRRSLLVGWRVCHGGRLTTLSGEMLQLKPEEMKAIASIVGGDAAAKDKAFADGLFIAGSRYVMARAEDRSIYARQVRGQ